MAVITGMSGSYNRRSFSHEPPEPHTRWLDVVRAGRLTLRVPDNYSVLVRHVGNPNLERVTNG